MYVRKANGQLMVNLECLKKGLKRALGDDVNYVNDESKENQRKFLNQKIDTADSANQSGLAPLWKPRAAVVTDEAKPSITRVPRHGDLVEGGNDEEPTSPETTINSDAAPCPRSVQKTPGQELIYFSDTFPSPENGDGCVFSSRKYRAKMDDCLGSLKEDNGGTHYASVERSAADSLDSLMVASERNSTQRRESRKKEDHGVADSVHVDQRRNAQRNPFRLFMHK